MKKILIEEMDNTEYYIIQMSKADIIKSLIFPVFSIGAIVGLIIMFISIQIGTLVFIVSVVGGAIGSVIEGEHDFVMEGVWHSKRQVIIPNGYHLWNGFIVKDDIIDEFKQYISNNSDIIGFIKENWKDEIIDNNTLENIVQAAGRTRAKYID